MRPMVNATTPMRPPRGRPRTLRRALVAALVSLVAVGGWSGCGGDGYDAPAEPARSDCPRIDDHLAPVYALLDAGELTHLQAAISVGLPEDARRDLVDALLRLVADFEPGTFTALAGWLDGRPDAPDGPDGADDPGVSSLLADALRFVATDSPAAPYPAVLRTLRGALTTCDGPPVLTLLADALDDGPLLRAVLDVLTSGGLADALAGLETSSGADSERGREALRLLVRNLLVAATGPDFDVRALIDLLDFIVDLDAAPWPDLVAGLERLIAPGPGLDALQGLLTCLLDVDPDASLGAFVFDLVTSDALDAHALLDAAPGPGEPALAPELARVLTATLRFLAADPEARRALAAVGVELLREPTAPGVLGDAAALLDAGALTAVLEVLARIATRACAP